MKDGTIILVQSLTDKLSLKIQEWQSKNDALSGIYNHSAYGFNMNGQQMVIEADYIYGRKIKAAMVIRSLSKYTEHPDKYRLLFLVPRFDVNPNIMAEEIARINGVPYDYFNILLFNPIQILTGWWFGRKGEKSTRRLNCHEGVMTLTNRIHIRETGQLIFEQPNKNDVRDIYYNTHYKHNKKA